MEPQPVKLLTIGGSDSGGAAGVQADLKTFTLHRHYGMSVITVVTAQNSEVVVQAEFLPLPLVLAQLDAVLSDYGAEGIKTGFLGREALVQGVGEVLGQVRAENAGIPLVIDPVLVNHRGESMFPPAVAQAYIDHLFPLATLITPNRREVEVLTGQKVVNLGHATNAARDLLAMGPAAVLITGLRFGASTTDLLYDGRRITLFRSPHIQTAHTHGSGDALSAAILGHLVCGQRLSRAIQTAHDFVTTAITRAASWQMGRGHGPIALIPEQA